MISFQRHRRLRRAAPLRKMLQETNLAPNHLIAPFFVTRGAGVRTAIASMPGQFQLSVDQLLEEVGRAERAGIAAVLLFGLPKKKDAWGREAYESSGVIQKAARALKQKFPKMLVFTDLCFCEYTQHGHCGVLKKNRRGPVDVDNDATLRLLQKAAVAQARAGADFVAPSGMMDGAVASIRRALDRSGFKEVGVLAYAAKYASVFYGPFRDAAGSAPSFGDRKTYQMNPGNAREALKEIHADIAEGADMVMVKPGLSYLDIIARIRPEVRVPLVAYNVSGEYAMVKAAEERGWLGSPDEPRVALEILLAMRRAGADLIITYHAVEAATYLRKKISNQS